MHLKYCTKKIYIQPKYHACTRNKNYVRTEEIQISNVNVIVLWHSPILPFNQSQESLRRMAFNEAWWVRVEYCRVAKCHRYDRYI